MRELHYAVEGKRANLRTFAADEPGHGGACNQYMIRTADAERILLFLNFQNGPISTDGNGVNGIQHEDLLAIIIDRLEGFQSGIYACRENQLALQLCRCVLHLLQDRTRNRIDRGVEGTHDV